jgi:hypothetical protein
MYQEFLNNYMKAFLLVLTIFLYGCKGEKEYDIFDGFPKKGLISSEEFFVPVVFSSGENLILTEDLIIVVDTKSDFVFHTFDRFSFSYKGSYLRRGRGPNEEEEIFNPYMRKVGRNKLLYQTPNNVKTVFLDVEEERVEIIENIELLFNLGEFKDMFFLEDNLIGYNIESPERKEFFGFNPVAGKRFGFGGNLPCLGREIQEESLVFIEGKVISVKPDQTLFAAGYINFPILRIFEPRTGMPLSDTRLNLNQPFPDAYVSGSATLEQYYQVFLNYQRIVSTNNLIYLLHRGESIGNINKKGSPDISNIIHVFDWDGQPIKELELDREIYAFDVSDDDSFLVAVSMNHPDRLFKFNLNH